jgi:hypothetical protein
VSLPHEIATVVGRTGSGKTQLLARKIAPRHRRRITVDLTGECEALYPYAYRATSLRQVYRALALWSKREIYDWHMVVVLEHADLARLVWTLCPRYDGTSRGLSSLWGGVCLEVFEVDVLLPVNGSGGDVGRAMKNACARGRHEGLSLLCATQRPHQCDRILTSQSHHVISFAMHEPNDTKWLKDVGGSQFAAIARGGLAQYESVWYSAGSGELAIYDADYRLIRTVPAHGDVVPTRGEL